MRSAAAAVSGPTGVFLNCPFDAAYRPMFRAITFAVYACGFRVRSALEIDDSSELRLEKIYRLIDECRFGIHDLSRTQLDAVTGLPRFNMPLELGIFLGAKRFGGARHKTKRALVFDIEHFRYQRFISDIAGMDIHGHGNAPMRAIRATRNWLANVSRRGGLPSPHELERMYAQFQKDLPRLAEVAGFHQAHLPMADFEVIVAGWLLSV